MINIILQFLGMLTHTCCAGILFDFTTEILIHISKCLWSYICLSEYRGGWHVIFIINHKCDCEFCTEHGQALE